jgi:hypothetical protein
MIVVTSPKNTIKIEDSNSTVLTNEDRDFASQYDQSQDKVETIVDEMRSMRLKEPVKFQALLKEVEKMQKEDESKRMSQGRRLRNL